MKVTVMTAAEAKRAEINEQIHKAEYDRDACIEMMRYAKENDDYITYEDYQRQRDYYEQEIEELKKEKIK